MAVPASDYVHGGTEEEAKLAWSIKHYDGLSDQTDSVRDAVRAVANGRGIGTNDDEEESTDSPDEEEEVELNDEQQEIFRLYRDYLLNPRKKPPPVVLLHGMAGTGKTTVAHRIMKVAEELEKKTNAEKELMARMAFNHINALALHGDTIASRIHLHKQQAFEMRDMSAGHWQQFVEQYSGTILILIDEISNVAPYHLAHISFYFQKLTGVYDKPFGGIPALLMGDMFQNGPVRAGVGLAHGCTEIALYDYKQQNKRRRHRRSTSA
jgi:DNA-binding NtrC family response regulator